MKVVLEKKNGAHKTISFGLYMSFFECLKPYSVFSACRARGRVCLEHLVFTKLYELPLILVLKIKTTTIHKNFFRNKLFRDGAISFYLDQLVSIRVSKFTYVTQTTNISLETRSPPFLGQGVSVGLSVFSYPKTLSCLFPFFKSLCYFFFNYL